MWRPESARRTQVIRCGAKAVELWQGTSSALSLAATAEPRERASMFEPAGLVEAMRSVAAQIEHPAVAMVLESALVPVLLVDTGAMLTSAAQVEALLQHRFAWTYGTQETDVSSWKLRWHHRFGDRFALGFAIAPAVESALVEFADAAEIKFTAWNPALSWGLSRFRPWRHWTRQSGWWAWPEQDRMLLARIAAGSIEGLDPAAPLALVQDIERLIHIEEMRSGVATGPQPIGAGRWQARDWRASTVDRIRWFDVAPEVHAPVTANDPRMAGARAEATG